MLLSCKEIGKTYEHLGLHTFAILLFPEHACGISVGSKELDHTWR